MGKGLTDKLDTCQFKADRTKKTYDAVLKVVDEVKPDLAKTVKALADLVKVYPNVEKEKKLWPPFLALVKKNNEKMQAINKTRELLQRYGKDLRNANNDLAKHIRLRSDKGWFRNKDHTKEAVLLLKTHDELAGDSLELGGAAEKLYDTFGSWYGKHVEKVKI